MEAIAREVLTLYQDLPKSCSLGEAEFTVLAAIVAERTETGELKVLSLATGTKCCGEGEHASWRKHGTIVNDSHAEVLARRSFHLHVINSISALFFCENQKKQTKKDNLIASSDEEATGFNDENILELVNGKARLRNGIKLNLYISDNPCGDASIYTRLGEEGEENERYTGAKRAKRSNSGESGREQRQELGVLRTKSGRSDIPDDRRSVSMSCSDKICRWLYLGLQGATLSPFVDFLPISRIVVGLDPAATKGSQLVALNRAIRSRIEKVDGMGGDVELVVADPSYPSFAKSKCAAEEGYRVQDVSVSVCDGCVKEEDKKRKRKKLLRPSGASINWVRDVKGIPQMDVEIDSTGGIRKASKARVCNVQGGTLEVTQAQCGSLMGISKVMVGSWKGSSRLCSRKRTLLMASLLRHAFDLQGDGKSALTDTTAEGTGNLARVKRKDDKDVPNLSGAIKLSYPDCKQVDRLYVERRRKFLAQPFFKDWLVNPKPPDFTIEINKL